MTSRVVSYGRYFLLSRAQYAWIGGGTLQGWHMSHWFAANKTRPINFRDDLRAEGLFDNDYGVTAWPPEFGFGAEHEF